MELPPLDDLRRQSRDVVIRRCFECGFSYELILCFLVQCGFNISLRTLKRALRRMGLRRRGNYSSLESVVDCLLIELSQSGSLLGYRSMHRRLRMIHGVRIQREVVREMLLILDSEAVHQRRQHRLIRRRYNGRGPNFIWHMDGNDKLITYGFAIHGCIDGFSRKILWLEVSITNKNSKVIAGYYLNAVCKYKGCPRMLRCDRGTENSTVAFVQPFLRRNGIDRLSAEKSFQFGRSASNQRIESWWSMMRRWCTDWWMGFFEMLKIDGHFDETDPIHVDCMRFAFMDLLQKELNELKNLWNTHIIRCSNNTTVSGIPDELYYIPSIHGRNNYSCTIDNEDIEFCRVYSQEKPAPVPLEFLEVANILMHDLNWNMPENISQALSLYLNLVHCLE